MYFDPELGHIIEDVVKDSNGVITAYQIETNEIIPKEQAVIMAKQGTIKGVSMAISNLGDEFLDSIPDNEQCNGLENLPVVGTDDTV